MTVRILVGDVREKLAELPADHFDCVLTSPPYWGLRSYLQADHPNKHLEIGCEPTLGEHLEVIVGVMDQVRRVLKPSGVCFVNYGDCYATSPNGRSAADTKSAGTDDRTFRDKPFSTVGPIYGGPRAQGYGIDDTAGSGSQDRGLISRSRDGGRKGAASNRTADSDFRRALGQALAPLTQIQACMASLLYRLPIGGSARQTAPQLSAGAIVDLALAAARALESLHDAQASTTPLSSPRLRAGYPRSDTLSACLSSLRSFASCVRRCAHMLDAEDERQHCTADSASLCEELTYCTQCSVACCSAVASWLEYSTEPHSAPILKPKDLCLVPQRLAIALQERGWWVRSLLPWVKRNGMPESISDRPASSIEYVIMLTKSERYAYDAESVRRPASPSTNARVAQNVAAQAGSDRANGGAKSNGPMKAVVRGQTKQDATAAAAAAAAAGGSSGRRMSGFNERWDAQGAIRRPKRAAAGSGIRANDSFENATCHEVLNDRNFRNSDLLFDSLQPPFGLISGADGLPIALDVCPQGFKEAHFATFPEALALPLLKAGNPACGPVLDPFGGAGTVGLVADRLGMDATLIELNEESADISLRRIHSDAGMFATVEVAA